ncbi:MAG: RsiV family protein, partial [Bacillota bacterium]
GRLYQLQDLFKPGADYVARLSEIIGIQIERRNIPILGEFTGIRPDQDFYIADKALVIYFQLYEITPYAYGFPYFPISVYEIQDIIDEEGPLGKMMGSF